MINLSLRIASGLAVTAGLLGCAPGPGPVPTSEVVEGPFLRVLGTVQDGGFPHAACNCTRCDAAREHPALRRRVSSLAVCLPGNSRVYLLDATPDIRRQLDSLTDVRPWPEGRVNRAPVDGVFLTHAHVGHYLGLAFFGFEAIHTRDLPVYCTRRMGAFLGSHAPWDQLVRLGNIRVRDVLPTEPVDLGDGVTITALPVPHRDEYADTVGFLIRGPRSRVLYVPDTDAWGSWSPPLPEIMENVDIAILDGTFYSTDELPGRSVSSIGHPLIVDSMDLLEAEMGDGRPRTYFTHLNHSNPALETDSPARREIEKRGFGILREGEDFPL